MSIPRGDGWKYDGHAYFRLRIEMLNRRGKMQYRWVVDRHFVTTEVWRVGMWTRSEARAIRRGKKRMPGPESEFSGRVINTDASDVLCS